MWIYLRRCDRCKAKSGFALVAAAVAIFVFSPASAGAPDRDKAWDALIENAKARGGVETKLDQSASYVFQREDGVYVAFTRLLKEAKRSVCLIDKDQHATVCIDWDTGKTRYGERADSATPWRVREGVSPEEVAAHQPGLLDRLWSMLQPTEGKRHAGYWAPRGGDSAWKIFELNVAVARGAMIYALAPPPLRSPT